MPTDAASPTARTPTTAYEAIGGAENIAKLVNRFYDLMETDPAYARLRAIHAADLAPMRVSLAGFLTGWMGGPRDWFDARENTCMMTLHSRFKIDQGLADDWAGAMGRALDDTGVDPEFAGQMREIIKRLCAGMVNT
ncbi:MAG: group II truncated hemoglobin [Parvularculaceae bacterium]